MTPHIKTALIVTGATGSTAVLLTGALARFTHFAPSQIAALTVGWIIGCSMAFFILIDLFRDASARVDTLAYLPSVDEELAALTEDGGAR